MTNASHLMTLSDEARASGDHDKGFDLGVKAMIASGCCCPECDEMRRITRNGATFICETCEHAWTEDEVTA